MTNTQKDSPISKLGLGIWGIAAAFFLYEFFLRTFIGSIAHQVMPDLKLNAENFAILGSSYYIAYGVMQIPVGILADKFGVKINMIIATFLCALSAYLFAHATGFLSALLCRLLMGFGSSFAFICLLIIATTWFPRKQFGFFVGLSQFIGTLGPILAAGPLINWMSSHHQGWRYALSNVAIIGILLSVLSLLFVKNKQRTDSTFTLFLHNEKPLLEALRILVSNKQAWLIALYSACVYVTLALMGAVWGTEFLMTNGYTQSVAANIISAMWLAFAISCPILGALSDVAKRRKPLLVCTALTGCLAAYAIALNVTSHSLIFSYFLFICIGISGAGQNIGFATIAEHVCVHTRATALGLNNGAITLFAAIMPPLISYFIYQASGREHHLKPEHFKSAFLLLPVCYLIAAAIALFLIRETYCKPQKEVIVLQHSDKHTLN